MAAESFEDEATAAVMNELFINIKLDRDERPDIDRRYQQAVAAMGGGSGWPLSVFLTPDRQAFYGGTYFPPEDRQGRPGFANVLRSVSEFYRTQKGSAEEYAARVVAALRPEALVPGDISRPQLSEAEQSMLAQVDLRHGGFGTAPKFPMPGALEFLVRRSTVSTTPEAGRAARRMLDAMADGGFHDHLGSGFHRYSVDEAWTIPHFEKMADDNAGLLRNYIDGYALFRDERFLDVARGIIRFTREVLSDPAGGFYASQDADVTPDDEGGYFTWTDQEFRRALDPDEYALLSAYLLHEAGSMHHDPARNVLFVSESLPALAARLGKQEHEVGLIVENGMKKLLDARRKRETPFIDTTLYTSLNGMMISSFFHAYNVLGEKEVGSFARMSLERILRKRLVRGTLLHAEDIPAVLDDHVNLIDALIAAYEATAETRYLKLADELMADCVKKFFDGAEGGFFDTEAEVLGMRLKRIEDVPHPSANALVIMVLLKLALLIDKDEYRRMADRSLRIFAEQALEMGVHAGSYFCSFDASFRMLELTVEAKPDSDLARASRAFSGSQYTAIVYGEDKGRVIPCKGNVCFEPITDPRRLHDECMKL